MGDDNIDSELIWAGEEVDGTENPDLVDEGDNDDSDNDSSADEAAADKILVANEKISAENKSLKRKEKFEKLKRVKKSKYEEEPEATDVSTRSVESMVELIRSSEPISSINASSDDVKLSITALNFFDPSKSLHAPAKSSCIFVNSIAASVPAFRKTLNAETKSSEDNGSPLVLVICASANRATEVINSMSHGLKCKIAKLFAKHFKVQDQIDLLSKQYFPVAVGTPNRMSKLVELGALSLSRVKVILVDMAVDEKQFSILTMPIVKEDFYSFIMNCIQPELSHLKMTLIERETGESKAHQKLGEEKLEGNNNSISRKGKSRFNKGKFSTKRQGF